MIIISSQFCLHTSDWEHGETHIPCVYRHMVAESERKGIWGRSVNEWINHNLKTSISYWQQSPQTFYGGIPLSNSEHTWM